MYPVRTFALVMGIVFVLVGIMGFVPALVTHPVGMNMQDVSVHMNHGYLLGLFPVNVVHNLVHILFGIWGIAAYSTGVNGSRLFARAVTVIYAFLAIIGLFPHLNTLFGLCPIHGNDTWLHGLIACVAAFFGWAPVANEPTTEHPHTGTPLPR